MGSTIQSNRYRSLTLFSLILAGESIFFLPFVLARIFRPTLLAAFEITNTELGAYFSVYGIVAMVSYLFGGPLADRFSARNLMSIALWLTAIGGFVMAAYPASRIMILVYGFWGLTTILLFWAALIKATREWGGENFQGKAFGWLEGGRGLAAALLGTFSLLLFSSLMQEEGMEVVPIQRIHAFRWVILAISFLTIIAGVIIWLFVPRHSANSKSQKFELGKVLQLAKKPSMWMLTVIIVCAYVGYKITDDFSLYAREVLGYNEVRAAGVGTAALWMRAIVAITVGFLADRTKIIRIISICFALSVFGGLLLSMGIIQHIIILALLNLTLVMVGIYGVRALYFALIHEARIPIHYTGTAVGLVCLIGFTPDIFMSPWMGYLLDKNPGAIGHQHVFLVLSCFSVTGLVISSLFEWYHRNNIIRK